MAERHALGLSSFAASDIARPIELADIMPLAQQLEAFERRIIERALADSGGRISEVIEKLGVPRRTLNEKMTRLGIRRREAEDQHRQ